MTIFSIVAAFFAVVILTVGFTFHLGWRHGWIVGFGVGKDGSNESQQPRVKHLFGLIYALGWHKGWDYGFREGMRKEAEQRKVGKSD
jgi:hypothetical protein